MRRKRGKRNERNSFSGGNAIVMPYKQGVNHLIQKTLAGKIHQVDLEEVVAAAEVVVVVVVMEAEVVDNVKNRRDGNMDRKHCMILEIQLIHKTLTLVNTVLPALMIC